MYVGDLLKYGPCSPIIVVSQQKAPESGSCSVHGAECLCCSNLALRTCRAPASLQYTMESLKKLVLILLKECYSNRRDGHTSKSEDKQAASKFISPLQEEPPTVKVDLLLQIILMRKMPHRSVPVACVLGDSRCSQVGKHA